MTSKIENLSAQAGQTSLIDISHFADVGVFSPTFNYKINFLLIYKIIYPTKKLFTFGVVMNETKLVDLTILNRRFKVKVETQNEAIVQQRIQEIQAKLTMFKTNFPGKDVQDYLSMALIDAVSTNLQNETSQHQQQEIILQLQKINEILD